MKSLSFAIVFVGVATTAACCLQTAESGSPVISSDGGSDGGVSDGGVVVAPLVWPPGTGFIATGDLNRDGIQDLALLTSSFLDGGLYLYYGLSDGGLAQGPILGLPSSGWDELVVFDLDGDGWPDLIASGESQIGIAMNQGDGGFALYSETQWSCPLKWVQAADFDGSGRADLVVGGYCGVSLFSDEGAVPSFSASSTFPLPPKTDLQNQGDVVLGLGIGDLDGDGQADIVTYEAGVYSETYLIVRRGLGDGGFLAPELYPSNPNPPSNFLDSIYGSILVVDVNGDGIRDVVAATYSGFTLRLGLGGGRLGSEVDIEGSPPARLGTTSLVLADSSEGARREVVTSGSWNGCVDGGRVPLAFVDDGGGNFATGVPFSVGLTAPGPVAAWTPAGASRPRLVVGDSCSPLVSFMPE